MAKLGICLEALMEIQRETMQRTEALTPQVDNALKALDKFKSIIVVDMPNLYHSNDYSALNIRIRKALEDMQRIAADANQLRNALNVDVDKVSLISRGDAQ